MGLDGERVDVRLKVSTTYAKASMSTPKKQVTNQRRSGLLEFISTREDARDTIRAMLAVNDSPSPWRGLLAVPPGSPMDTVLGAFHAETDIPLEIPFFALLHLVSGRLLERRVKIKGRSVECYADLWTIVLAPSGAGKTLAHNVLAKASPVKSEFPEVASGARFIEALKTHNFGLWFQDEIAQKLKQIENPGSPLADVKEYLLRAYGYDKIERSTKKETITIDEPCIGILGLNTPESFMKALSPESMVDGFAQRFAFVLADRDPARPMVDYPLYNLERLGEAAQKAFAQIEAVPLPEVFEVEDGAETAFRESFRLLCKDDIPESFFRRIMFRSFKYAALYHVLLGKSSPVIDAADIGWGGRAAWLHLSDMKRITGQGSLKEVISLADKARSVKKRFQAKGVTLTARAIQQSMRGVKTAKEAAELLAVVS